MKLKRLGLLSVILMLNGCAVHSSTYSSAGYISGSTGIIHYSYGNGYWYDNSYDYYDGLYGEFIGGVFYVVRRDGRRFPAPKPRHPHHRFTEKGWPGYNHMNTGPWHLNNGNRPPPSYSYPPHRPDNNGYKPIPPKYPYSPRPGDNNGYHKPIPPKYPYSPRPGNENKNRTFKDSFEPRSPQHWNYDKEFRR